MSSKRPAVFIVTGSALVLAACGRDVQQKTNTSKADSTLMAAASQPHPRNTGWDEAAAGTFIVMSVADDSIDAALVLPEETDSSLSKPVPPNIASFANASVDLFSTDGLSGTSVLAINPRQQPAEGCLGWPSVRLTTKPRKNWRVGFMAGKATGITIRPIEELGASDSSSSTIEMARLASEATATNSDPAFQGLPFTVRRAYQLSIGDTLVLVGSVVRKINEEANPREEHLLVVG